MANHFTDNRLSQLYLGLMTDYRKLIENSDNSAAHIYWTLYWKVYTELSQKDSVVYGLDPQEQAKVWAVFNSFIASTPLYKNDIAGLQQLRNKENIDKAYKNKIIYVVDSSLYCRHDAFFDWAMLNLYFSSLHMHHHHGGWWSSHHHGHNSGDSINGEGLALLVVVILVLIAAALACLALYYMLSQTLDSLERFVWNEGWLQAFISLSSMAAFSAAGALLGTFLVASPLSALALAAGISNPVGLVIFTTICLSLAIGALGCFATNALQKHLSKNADAIDPKDACRFRLTDSETQHLLEIGLDPVAVKCAIVTLRAKMGEEEIPSLLNRWFTNKGGEKQALLNQVRQLRRGELETIDIDDLSFNLRQPQIMVPAYYYNTDQNTYNYQPAYLYPQTDVPQQYHNVYDLHHHGHPSTSANDINPPSYYAVTHQ